MQTPGRKSVYQASQPVGLLVSNKCASEVEYRQIYCIKFAVSALWANLQRCPSSQQIPATPLLTADHWMKCISSSITGYMPHTYILVFFVY